MDEKQVFDEPREKLVTTHKDRVFPVTQVVCSLPKRNGNLRRGDGCRNQGQVCSLPKRNGNYLLEDLEMSEGGGLQPT